MKLFAASVSVIIYGSIAFAGDMPANLKPLATTAIETDESARKINSAAAIKQANAPRMAAAATTSATLIGSEIALFESLRSNNYGSGTCQNARFYFDGPISPISYRTGDATTISIMAAVAAVVGPVHNQQLTGMITGSGPAASISRLSSPNQCIPSYVSVFSNDPNSFEWAEWLTGCSSTLERSEHTRPCITSSMAKTVTVHHRVGTLRMGLRSPTTEAGLFTTSLRRQIM